MSARLRWGARPPTREGILTLGRSSSSGYETSQRGFEPGHGAFAGEFAFEFRECAEDVEDQAAAGAGGVYRFGE